MRKLYAKIRPDGVIESGWRDRPPVKRHARADVATGEVTIEEAIDLDWLVIDSPPTEGQRLQAVDGGIVVQDRPVKPPPQEPPLTQDELKAARVLLAKEKS